MARPYRLLSIAHSYCVALNRRLANEMARVGAGKWEVTAVAPSFFHGDLRPVPLERYPGELCRLEAIPTYFSKYIHVMLYGWRLREILQQDWDMVHCWEEPYIFAGGQLAWWTPTRTMLVYATFQNMLKTYPPPFSSIEKYAMDRATGWIAFGNTIEQALTKKSYYSTRPRCIIPPGVDVEHFRRDPSARHQIYQKLGWVLSGPPVVGYLGRFVPEKGLELLTRTLDRLLSPWRALFVGSGPMEEFLRTWGSRYGDRVRVTTGVKHDQVPAYLNVMNVLCVPSQTMANWREQFGRMLVEAFACGVPVLASDSGEIPYVVSDAGMIVGEKDEPGWVRALSELLGDPHRRAELSARGIERAHTVYTWPIIAKQYLDFFCELLDSPKNT